MNTSIFDDATPAELRRYIEFLLWHYRVVDAFWFLYTTEDSGQRTAEQINQRVWAKAGELGARDLLKKFPPKQKGLEGFVEAMKLYPWCLLIDYHFEQTPAEVVLTVPVCPSQEARLRRGLPEYSCKKMHQAEFEKFAAVVDEHICVECLFAPPDEHPKELFCKWRFTLRATPPVTASPHCPAEARNVG